MGTWAGAGLGQDPDLEAQSGHFKKKKKKINREREFLGNEAPYGPLLAEGFKIL